MKKSLIIGLTTALLCGVTAQATLAQTPLGAPSPITSASDQSVHLRGVVMPIQQSKLSINQSGALVKLLTEGTLVKKGTVLAKIDDRAVRIQITQAEASMETAQLAIELAQHSLNKTIRLKNEKIVSDIAITEGEFEVKTAKAGLKAAKATLQAAKLSLSECTLVAPFAGVVMNITAHIGEFVGPGSPMLELADLTQLELAIDAPPHVLAGLKVGTTTAIHADGLSLGQAIAKRILPMIDPASGLQRVVWRIEPKKGTILAGRYVSLDHWGYIPTMQK